MDLNLFTFPLALLADPTVAKADAGCLWLMTFPTLFLSAALALLTGFSVGNSAVSVNLTEVVPCNMMGVFIQSPSFALKQPTFKTGMDLCGRVGGPVAAFDPGVVEGRSIAKAVRACYIWPRQ